MDDGPIRVGRVCWRCSTRRGSTSSVENVGGLRVISSIHAATPGGDTDVPTYRRQGTARNGGTAGKRRESIYVNIRRLTGKTSSRRHGVRHSVSAGFKERIKGKLQQHDAYGYLPLQLGLTSCFSGPLGLSSNPSFNTSSSKSRRLCVQRKAQENRTLTKISWALSPVTRLGLAMYHGLKRTHTMPLT